MKDRLVCESLLEFSTVSGGDSKTVALNIIKRFRDNIVSAIKKNIIETTDGLKSLPYEEYFDRKLESMQVSVENDSYAKSILQDNSFIIDVKISGFKNDKEYVFETSAIGIYFTVPSGSDVAEFFDKDELTETGAFITFSM